MHTYRRIYYRLYRWNLGMWGPGDGPQYNVCVWLAAVLLLNFLSLSIAFRLELPDFSRPTLVAFYLLSLAAHYLYFVRSGRFELLASEFSDEPASRVQRVVPFLYAFGSPVLLAILVGIRGPAAA